MNNVEEQLWSYIDGTCSPAEEQAIIKLIAQDAAYRVKYNELLKLNEEFSTMELDEPSMAFTYKVMETIRTENAMQPLKTTINKRIIWGIAAFFLVSIAVLLILAFGSVNWSVPAGNTSLNIDVKMPELVNGSQMKTFFSGTAGKGFLFFDVVMGLFLFDAYLRRKKAIKQH